jgi:hypothetical protein
MNEDADFARTTRASYQRAVAAAEARSYYLVGDGVVTTFYNADPEHWDFFRENGSTIFSDSGFLRHLNGPGDPVHDLVRTLENMS